MSYASVFRPDLFAGQTVIITGGGSGIGRCTAHELAALGAHVAIIGRNVEKLDRVRAEVIEDGGAISAHVCDIRDEAQVAASIDAVLVLTGRLDGLVNNAGGQWMAPLKTISTNGFEAVVRNNLTGGFIFMREAHARWMARHGGAIVNIIADIWHGWPNFGHSAAARGGMLSLSESAACEWAGDGVRVNTVAPGGIASSGFDRYTPEARRELRQYAAKVPLKRFGTEAEVSAAIVFLLSPAAAFITGSCVRVDGGTPNARQTWPLAEASRNTAFEGFHRAVAPTMLSESD
ncbi:SDR family oxidoreductase [Denitromonas ohlonensis]|uniref:Peroxisomal trans-2-enoyl-CoA reductase n=2 Tax=Denitromonas TaxID=139331 RepID=A0A557REK2_9RHOO|nr:SDR family oxidoreductase [Denitromonas ohlonensis]TVT48694.1 MAG: SDR family oxidoreductase [Denitromonas halophila]TVO63563.1 SDR family oxidoreductase [Denitromonas ohlonensis]TVO75440.1 SDR family oxidoreductase [Denitromonas ohlonensis]TVT70561.1 MAG: SDR family oxidoreductase [Denitromonas halophila]TVT75683.1 MAG: SDR family oxidoreductase [Denitromonas halophila]